MVEVGRENELTIPLAVGFAIMGIAVSSRLDSID